MKCSDVVDQLVEHLLTRQPATPVVPDEIMAHIVGCPSCIAELDAISSALTGKPSRLREQADRLLGPQQPAAPTQDETLDIACRECLDTLGSYVEDQLAGEDVARLYPQIARHLENCPSCREQHDSLYELLREEAAGTFGEPPSYLSFGEWFRRQEQPSFEQASAQGLQPPAPSLEEEPTPFRWDRLGRLIIDLATALWQPPQRLALAYAVKGEEPVDEARAKTEGLKFPLRFSLGSPDVDDLQLDITAVRDRDNPELCTLVARVEIPSRWSELAGTEITLMAGEETYTEFSDESGEVTFKGIPISRLAESRLRVRPRQPE